MDEILNLSRLRSCFQIVYNLLNVRSTPISNSLSKKDARLLSIPTPDPFRLLLAHSFTFILVLVNSLAICCLYLELNYIYAFNVVLFMTWTIHIISKI